MKKIVPDPPPLDISTSSTASIPFGTNLIFNVRAGIPAEEALLHACHLLGCAKATVDGAVDSLRLNDQSLVAGAGTHIEAAHALVEAVLKGAEVKRMPVFP